jgi:hypothetical protein
MSPRLLLTAAAVMAALALGGCTLPFTTDQSAHQADVIGDVHVVAEACSTPENTAVSGVRSLRAAKVAARGIVEETTHCPSEEQVVGDLGHGWSGAEPHQQLVAFRVPEGAQAPGSFTARLRLATVDREDDTVDVGTRTVTYRRAPELDTQVPAFYAEITSLTGETEADALPGPGRKVVGYVSDLLPGAVVGQWTIDAPFGLPAGEEPYAGSFNAMTLLGARPATPENAGRPVRCDALLRESGAEGFCPFPYEELFEGVLADGLPGLNVATRDLRVAGGEGFAEAGQIARVPVTLRAAGPEGGALKLTAQPSFPGAAAVESALTFPGTGAHQRSVDVAIPAGTAPGTYDVALTVSAAGGAQRTGRGSVVVLPSAAAVQQASQAPVVAGAPRGRDNLWMSASGWVRFGWLCGDACGDLKVDVLTMKAGIAPGANTAAVTKPRLLRVGTDTFRARGASKARTKVRLFPRAQRAVRRGKAVKAILVVRVGGDGAPVVRRAVIRRADRRK